MVTRSTGTTWLSSGDVETVVQGENSAAAKIRPCSSTETDQPSAAARRGGARRRDGGALPPYCASGFGLTTSVTKPDMGETRRGQHAHHFHHPAVIDAAVAAHEDALVIAVVGDGGELGHQLVLGHLLLLQDRSCRPWRW